MSDLRAPLRASESNAILIDAIHAAIGRKPKGHDFDYSRQEIRGQTIRHMNHTGG
jgi:cyclic pyranopterin phosphate synthase